MEVPQISERLIRRYPTLERLEAIVDIKVTKLGYKSRIVRVKLTYAAEETCSIR